MNVGSVHVTAAVARPASVSLSKLAAGPGICGGSMSIKEWKDQ